MDQRLPIRHRHYWGIMSTGCALMEASKDRTRSDQSTLGGEKEMGIALRPPTCSINQGCYLCQGMMGYQPPKS
ncbi:hypothetical protein J3E68DRAFT_404343 [Trichoderma sp. SZMC 28012]